MSSSKQSSRRNSRPSSSISGSSQSGKPSFECEICHKTFSRKDNRKTHQRLHSGEMPYECKFCGTPFRWAGALSTHEAIHVRNGDAVGYTFPSMRKRKDQDKIVVKPSRDGAKSHYGDRKSSKSSDPHGKAGRRDREHGGSSSGSRHKGRDMVVISNEDPTLDMFTDGHWRTPLDEDGRY